MPSVCDTERWWGERSPANMLRGEQWGRQHHPHRVGSSIHFALNTRSQQDRALGPVGTCSRALLCTWSPSIDALCSPGVLLDSSSWSSQWCPEAGGGHVSLCLLPEPLGHLVLVLCVCQVSSMVLSRCIKARMHTPLLPLESLIGCDTCKEQFLFRAKTFPEPSGTLLEMPQ